MAARRKATEKPAYKILSIDPYLGDFAGDIDLRMQRYAATRKVLLGEEGEISAFANGHLYFGFHRTQEGWVYREWAPGADEMHLIGDFNGWDRASHPMERKERGVWEIRLRGSDALRHEQRVKVQITRGGERFDRIPLYCRYVTQEKETGGFTGRVWAGAPFRWSDAGFNRRAVKPLFIYEAHVGMAQEKEGIGSYREFADQVLPRVREQGYNAVQLMAIAQHPYYGSFGYQVSNFFAPSSWFGTPDDLKYLVDKAHGMGLYVLMDLVHSHAATNTAEGINLFDGTEDQFFHAGPRGRHPAWDTRLFNYGKHEVIHFLLSNIKYWMEEYHFDGFRFDGVTSMLYHDHGLGRAFTSYDTYFSMNTDVEAVTYLQLANELIHSVNPFAVTIAEDMSGMPGMALPIRWGGVGFDYRLSMGVPDMWVKALKKRDEDWDMGHLWYELTTGRPQEKTIGYCECHDQALVGDKTIIFRMADAEMYTGMQKSYHSFAIDRAVALDNLIRFVTLTLAGEGWLNFMGNEFGHPEWIDFPREGNGWSYYYARRQWSLADNDQLKYGQLRQFDRDMLRFARKRRLLPERAATSLWIDHEGKTIAYAKRETVLLFNFHPTREQKGFFVPVGAVGAGTYVLEFDSDRYEYGGWGRFQTGREYASTWVEGRGEGFYIDLPCRAAVALTRVKEKA